MADVVVETPWAKTAEEVCAALGVDPNRGLSAGESEARRAQYGPNQIREAPRRTKWAIFLGQFAELMVALLAAAALISAVVGEWHDSVLIGLIVLANAGIGYVQENKAEEAVAALRNMSQPQARVWRDGTLTTVPAVELARGDVIEIGPGDLVGADARITSAAQLEVNESALTGESLPVEKAPAPVAPDALCNNAQLGEDGKPTGNATEAALLAAAIEQGQDVKRLRAEWRVEQLPAFWSGSYWCDSSSRRNLCTAIAIVFPYDGA